MTDWEQRSKENDIKIHKLEERINDLELEMKAEEVGQAGANQLIQERLEKLESSQCPHLKVGIATLNTKDMYCIHHSIFKEEAKEEIFQIIQRSKKKGCIGGKEKIEPLVKDSECERLNEEKWSLEKEISIRDKEIERLKSENYISREDMLKSCEQCIYKTIIAQALEYIKSMVKGMDVYGKTVAEITIKKLEGSK